MKNIHLKIVHQNNRTGSDRLCDTCAHGLVLRGEGMEFAYCAYLRDYVAVRVEECTRYTSTTAAEREESVTQLLAHYTLD